MTAGLWTVISAPSSPPPPPGSCYVTETPPNVSVTVRVDARPLRAHGAAPGQGRGRGTRSPAVRSTWRRDHPTQSKQTAHAAGPRRSVIGQPVGHSLDDPQSTVSHTTQSGPQSITTMGQQGNPQRDQFGEQPSQSLIHTASCIEWVCILHAEEQPDIHAADRTNAGSLSAPLSCVSAVRSPQTQLSGATPLQALFSAVQPTSHSPGGVTDEYRQGGSDVGLSAVQTQAHRE